MPYYQALEEIKSKHRQEVSQHLLHFRLSLLKVDLPSSYKKLTARAAISRIAKMRVSPEFLNSAFMPTSPKGTL